MMKHKRRHVVLGMTYAWMEPSQLLYKVQYRCMLLRWVQSRSTIKCMGEREAAKDQRSFRLQTIPGQSYTYSEKRS